MRLLEATASAAGGRTQFDARRSFRADALLLAILLAAAALIRLRTLGDLVSQDDEQFYLVVGDQMLRHSAIPYVDIWDRKPVGLFLLYAGIRLLGGEGIVQYQLVATAFAAATAGLIGLWIRRAVGWAAGLIAGFFYLIMLQAQGGFGGQAEVFMNLFVVAAGLIVVRELQRPDRIAALPSRLLWRGGQAMLLIGVAAQIKPTALMPGVWLGIVLLLLGLRARWSIVRLAGAGVVWILLAVAPTLAAAGLYAALGHLDSFIFASTSIAGRGTDGAPGEAAHRAAIAARMGLPFGLGAALLSIGCWLGVTRAPRLEMLIFLLGWLAAGVGAFYALPAAYLHYALVADPMGCLIIGYALGLEGAAQVLMALVAVIVAGRVLIAENNRVAANRALSSQVRAMAQSIRSELHGGCLYVFHGPVLLYRLVDSCLMTRFPFPGHLSTEVEAAGIGVDPRAEVTAILDKRPPVIVDGADKYHLPNPQTQAIVQKRLAAEYEPFAYLYEGAGPPRATAYRLKPAAAAQPLSSR